MHSTSSVSVIVQFNHPTNTLSTVIERIDHTLTQAGFAHEIILVDRSGSTLIHEQFTVLAKGFRLHYLPTDNTDTSIVSRVWSLNQAHFGVMVVMNGDGPDPPELLPEMLQRLDQAALVVADFRSDSTSVWQKMIHEIFIFIFGRMLHGVSGDVLSSLWAGTQSLLQRKPGVISPQTSVLELMLFARDAGYAIANVDVSPKDASQRSQHPRIAHIFDLVYQSLRAFKKSAEVLPITKQETASNANGFHYRGRKYSPFTRLRLNESALRILVGKQKEILIASSLLLGIYFFVDWRSTLIGVIGLIIVLYFSDLVFQLWLLLNSLKQPITHTQAIPTDLPQYTILCPLYKEWQVLSQFLVAIHHLQYPKDKLQVLLILESDDRKTIKKVKSLALPSYVEIVIVPDSYPKTKPKACNYALSKALGDYCVIYDAEDVPDPDQLLKVFMAFAQAPDNVVCLQAKLDFYNPRQNLLTRLFTAEYSLWFDLTLPGLQAVGAPIPLGGTSNHFKTHVLKHLGGWDPFNVTEDCDLGVRLSKHGFRTAMIDSVTHEEATSRTSNWFQQRSRWIKGYIQTFLVHSREPLRFVAHTSWFKFAAFVLTVGGKIASLYINPFLWITTLSYFLFRPMLGSMIESFFPPVIFYLAAIALVVGNFLYFYYYMIGSFKRQHYDLVKYCFFVPLYWITMSLAAWYALYRLITTPHHWPKTLHGFHLQGQRLATSYLKGFDMNPTYAGYR